MRASFETRPLGPFGVEVELDLAKQLNPRTISQIRHLLGEHSILVFRKQSLNMETQIRLGKRFGNVASPNGRTLGEYISNSRPDGILGNSELAYHSDLSFSRYPYDSIMMHAVDVVDDASSTRFASGALAYEKLDQETRDMLPGLQALLVWPTSPGGRNRDREVPPHYPRAVQPLLWTHPLTGRTSIYCDYNSTDRILGFSEEQSEALLERIWKVQLGPECVYEHYWKMGDVVFWDNMALLHARGEMSQVGNRTLQRVTIAEKGYADIFPQVDVNTAIGKLEALIPRESIKEFV